jgi:hypothetical protein
VANINQEETGTVPRFEVFMAVDSSRRLLRCDAVGRIPMFRRTVLPLPSPQLEDGESKIFRNIDILPQHYKVSQPKRPLQGEDGSRKVLRNVGILLQHYTASEPSRPGPEGPVAIRKAEP